MLTPLERARTPLEQRYAKAGVPPEFWRVQIHEIPLRQTAYGIGKKAPKLSPAVQRRALQQLAIEPRGQLTAIGSNPTDEGALMAASWAAMQLVGYGYTVRWVNAETTEKRLPQSTMAYCVHNVMAGCSDARAEAVRDLLLRWRWPVRMIAIAGTTDPYNFCCSRLGLRPDFCLRVEDPKP